MENDRKADKIFQSTCIFDSVSEEAYPGYVAIKGKQILEVGCGNIPDELVGESTEVVDYGEGTIVRDLVIPIHFHRICSGLSWCGFIRSS